MDGNSFDVSGIGGRAPNARWTGREPRVPRGWLRLPQKTSLILITLLMAVVALVGGIFFYSTESMLQASQNAQVTSFAYGVATTLGDMNAPNEGMIQMEFEALDKTPNLDFIVLTDPSGRQMAKRVTNSEAWAAFRQNLGSEEKISGRLGVAREVRHDGRISSAVTVPVLQLRDGQRSVIYGYLHAAFSNESNVAQLRFMQVFVLFTCIAVVLVAVPIAGLIARHITVPIQRLAGAAHALADGDLAHRVALKRSDELGELAEAFNRMADTLEAQQLDIRQSNANLELKVHQRTAELQKLNLRLEAEVAEKEDFLRAVSHDLNAPLRNIAGMASMLVLKYQSSLEADALQRLERIQKNVQVECELINELLELSRIKTRREKIERVDLHELATAVAEGFGSDLETRGIALAIEGRLPVMRCERMRMRQAFQNLLDNAIKYMRPEGTKQIRLSMKWDGQEAVFSVSDTGMGIAPDDLPQLFHVFRRAKNASIMKVPGKGVGLASVKSIVENYNGRLWVESVQGAGTTFHFAIPRSHFEINHEVAA